MKISDPLGKVYTHTMFKKRSSYDMKSKDPKYAKQSSEISEDEEDLEEDIEMEHEEHNSDISDQSDDSLSTKSSKLAEQQHQQRHHPSSAHVQSSSSHHLNHHHGSRREPRMSVSRGEERDREDAISFASRASRKSVNASQRRLPRATTANSSTRSRRSTVPQSSSKKYPPETGLGHTYNLWSSVNSLKRDHRRRFNRSLCGVLLGISIVLVILGILGIIGIAVYLGVVQKLDGDGRDLISVDGTFRVKSEEFSISLLNPDTNLYRLKAKKYSEAISNTYMKSNLKEAFVKTLIDGFASGSVRVFFKIILDKRYLPPSLQRDPVGHVKDILIQEIMTLSGGEFEEDDIDIDSILFDNSKLQETTQFYKPEPYQADEPEKPELPEKPENKSLWQNLMERPNNKVIHLKDTNISEEEPQEEANGFRSASARSDVEQRLSSSRHEDQFKPHLELSRGPTVYSPKIVPSIPIPPGVMNRPSLKFDPPLPSTPVPVQYSPSPVPNRLLSHSSTPSRRSGMMHHSTLGPIVTQIPNIRVRNPSLPTKAPSIMPRHGTRFSMPRNNNRNMNPRANNNNNNPFQNRRHDISNDELDSDLMSPFMEPPPKPQFGVPINHNRQQTFIPSIPAPANHPSNILSNRSKLSVTPASALIDRPSILITPKSDPPNSIPFHQESESKIKHQHFVTDTDLSNGPTLKTPQQMLREKIFGQSGNARDKHKNGNHKEDQMREPSSHFDNIWNVDLDSEELMMASESSNSDGKKNTGESLWTSLHKANYPHSMPIMSNSVPSSPRPKRLPSGNGGQSSSGKTLNLVDGVVMANQKTNAFKVGGSFAVTSKPQTAGKEIRVEDALPFRDDPNIIHAKQVPSGTQLHQGPHGPMITSPNPTNYHVTQTPSAPQMGYQNNIDKSMNTQNNPMGRGVGGNVVHNSHNLPGPGNYNPPLEISPRPMQGDPGSGQQLIKNYLMEKALIAEQNKLAPQIFPQRNQLHFFNGSPTPNLLTPQPKEGMPRPGPPKKKGRPPQRPSSRPNASSKDPLNAIPQALARLGQFDLSALSGIKRQDLTGSLIPAAAVGALTAGIGPLTVFSNLLNAYATMDSKHDITDKLVKSASQWLGVDENDQELTSSKTTTRPTTQTEATTTTTLTTMSSSSSQMTSSVVKSSEQWTTTTTPSTTRVMEDWYGAPYQAVVVDSDDLPPVKSNVNPDQPLRKKPPSLGQFKATPKPNRYGHDDNKYKHTFNQNSVQYGVSNPHFVSDNLPPVTDNYGPTDFVVETVKLDKDFFHHFFTAKPMLLGTDFVTSTSVQVNHGRKRGRETTADEFSDYEDSEAVKEMKIREMISQRIQSRLGEAATDPAEVISTLSSNKVSSTTATTTSTTSTTTTTTKTTTTTTTPQSTTFWTTTVSTTSTTTTSTMPPTTIPISRQSDTPIIVNNVHKFMRYQIPPEVKITHDLSVPKYATSEKTPVTSLHEIGGPRFNRFGKAGHSKS